MNKPMWMWIMFFGIILFLLCLDLGVLHKKNRSITLKESFGMTAFYCGIAILFGLWIGYQFGMDKFSEFLTGFLIEKSLSIDNIFLISLVFSGLSIPPIYHHRVLFWGILGVIFFRAIMIGLGAHLIAQFSWILYIFSFLLIVTGVKMFLVSRPIDIQQHPLLQWIKKYFAITPHCHGQQFWVRLPNPKSGKEKVFITPLLVALMMIESIDLIFAVDSIPAIFTITQDPYIIYTSNIFAVLGLRALYFSLSAILERFYYLKYSVALILIFIGSKIFMTDLIGTKKFPASVSLSVTIGLLLGGCLYSIYKTKRSK